MIRRYAFVVLVTLLLRAGMADAQSKQESASEPGSQTDPELRAYYAGNGLLNRGQYDAAITEYRAFLSAHAGHAKASVARYGVVVSLFRLERCDEALVELEGLRSAAEFPYAAEIWMIEGQCHLAKERFSQAAAAFDSVAKRFPESELADDAAAGSCEALYRAAEYESAAKNCQTVASRWPESPLLARSEFFQALAEMARKNYEEASRVLLVYEKKFPKGEFAGQVPLLLAQCYQRGNDADKAIERYAAVVKAGDPTQLPDALLGLSSLLYHSGKLTEAGKTLDTLIARFSDSAAARSSLMLRAHVWFAQNDLEKAFQAFEKAAKADKDAEAEAAYWMAKCELRRGDFSGAAKRLSAALEQFPQHPLQTEIAYDRALALVRAGDSQAALKALSGFLAKYLKHELRPDALLLAAGCEQQMGEYGRSLLLCDQFLKEFPAHARRAAMEFMAAENEMLDKHLSEAASRYRAFLKDFPEDEQADVAKLHLATTLYQLEEFDEAARYFEAVAPKAGSDERFRQALLALGDIAFQRGEWKNAEKWLGEYLATDAAAPSADDALMKLAYARQKQDRTDDALRDYGRLIEKYPQSTHLVQALFERGQLLAGRKQTVEAEESFKKALAKGPDSRFASPILNQLATLAAQRGAHEEAARLFGEAASKSGGDGDAAVLRQGQALIAAGKLAEAESAFGQVKSPEGAARRAITLARQNRPKEALAAIATLDLAKLSPELRESVRYEKAWALRSSENHAEAAGVYREIIAESESGPLRLHAMLELAELEATDKRYESAAKTLRELRELLAKQSNASLQVATQSLYRLGVCEFELGHFAEAADLFAQFVKEFPESDLIASSLFFAGESNFRAGRFDRSAKSLTKVLDEHAEADCDGPAMLRLGECHAALQQWALSEEVFQRFLERFPDSEQWFQAQFGVAWSRENQKRYDEAVTSYEKVTARHQGPTAARAQFQVGQCLFAQKKFEPAVRELLKVDILYAYPEWSAAALYEAGRCFMLMNDAVQARQQFTTVTEKFKDTRWAKLAGEQLAELSASSSLPGK